MTWNAGDQLIVRGARWRLVHTTPHVDCTALDLVSVERSPLARTVLLPFDRPRRAPLPRFKAVSLPSWSEHAQTLVSRTFPYGGLRFCPRTIQLLPYQLEPALAVFRHGASRVLIGDDVGLGKTVEAGVILREVVGRGAAARALVIVPAALKAQWIEELATLFGLSAIDADARWLRTSARELPPDVNPWSIPGIYLASIDFVKRPEALSPLEAVRWDLLVADEAHGATPGTGRLTAVDALGCRAATVVLLSATPHSGNQDQFEALCRIGSGASRAPVLCFRRSRADVDLSQPPLRTRMMTVSLSPPELAMHRLLERYAGRLWASSTGREGNPALLATVFRKRALSSASSLAMSLRRRLAAMAAPPKREFQAWLPLSDEAEGEEGDEENAGVMAGKGLEDEDGERAAIKESLRAAEAAAAAESKIARLVRLLRRVREPAIVFSEYRDTAVRLRDCLMATGRRVLLLHGGLSAAERLAATREFTRGDAVLVATDAASEGLNLQHRCRLVVHYELPWSPARLHQRCGRVNRIGQQRRVHEIALVAADTAEQLVLHPLLRRALQSGTFTPGAVVSQLTEALVASHVIAGSPIPELGARSAGASAEPFVTLDLRAEARAEAERLQTIRNLQHGSAAGGDARFVPIARQEHPTSSRERRRERSVTILFSLAFRNGDGELLEESLLAVAVEYAGRPWKQRPTALRAQVAATLSSLSSHLAPVIDGIARSREAHISALYRESVAAREQRRRAISRPLAAARTLVQPGLFGRSAPRPEPSPLVGLLDEVVRAEALDPRIAWHTNVEAVLCGRLP